MPTLSELLALEEQNRPEPIPENYFFPESGGIISHGLGALNLILGAPARAVQGAAIASLRGEDPLDVGLSSMLGKGIDTEEFGRGEVAQGTELLEELGVITDKERLGNVVAGIGVDVATDLLAFNVIGAGSRVAARAVGKGPGVLQKLGGKGIRWRFWKRDYATTTQKQTRELKRRFLMSLDPTQQASFIRQLKSFDRSLAKKFVGGKHKPGIFQVVDDQGMLRAKLRAPKELLGKGEAFEGIERTIRRFEDEINVAIDSFDLENLVLRFEDGGVSLQRAMFTPTFEDVGHATLTKEGSRLVQESTDAFKNMRFRVEKFALTSKYLGTNRRASFFDMRTLNAPRFFRDLVPANLPKGSPDLLVELAGKNRPNVLARIMENIIPKQFSPFDFTAVLRRVGIMPRMMQGHMALIRHAGKIDDVILPAIKKFEKASGQKFFGNQALQEKIARVADGIDLEDTLTAAERALKDEVEGAMTALRKTNVTDPVTGLTREVIPDEFTLKGSYLHHIRTDFQQPIYRDFVVETGIPRWNVNMIEGDMATDVFAAPLQKRLADSSNIHFDWWKSIEAYKTALLRKIHLEPALKEVLPSIRKLNQAGDAGTFRAAQSMVNMFFGEYSALDGYFDDLARAVGLQTRHLATKMSVGTVGFTYRAMLGLNPRTSLLQVHQGILNNSVHLGIFDTLKGFFRLDRNAALAYKNSKITNEMMKVLDTEFTHQLGKGLNRSKAMEIIDKTLFFGLNGLDNMNRGWAFHAGFGVAKRAGLADESAILQGIRAANETQFIYGKLGASPLRNNPLGRVLLQYQSFAAKQLSFMTQRFRQSPGITFARYMAISGMMTRNIGKHVDITSELAPTTPGDVKNLVTMDRIPGLLGLQSAVDFGRAVLQEAAHDAGIKPIGLGNAIDPDFAKEQFFRTTFTTLFPAGTMFGRFAKYQPTLEAADPSEAHLGVATARTIGRGAGIPFGGFDEGEAISGPLRTGGVRQTIDKYGRKIGDLTPGEAALGVLGFRTTQSRLDREDVEDIAFADAFWKRRYERLMTEALRAQQSGRDPRPFLTRASTVAQKQMAVVFQAFRMRVKNRALTLKQRRLRRAGPPVKQQFTRPGGL